MWTLRLDLGLGEADVAQQVEARFFELLGRDLQRSVRKSAPSVTC